MMGSVHSFERGADELVELERRQARGEDWTDGLRAIDVMLTPAACYPLYPTVSGTVGPEGRTIDLRAFVFRHEPSNDPSRMQLFRQREYVRIGTPVQAVAHRDEWL